MNRFPDSQVSAGGCDCCSGSAPLTSDRAGTARTTANRPGLAALGYRVGTYASFLDSMQARLSSRDYPALAGLKTRASDDPSLALLDAWATVADVLSFYNERSVNEGFLRTALHAQSVTELARLVGYQPRPGVAASVHLAYTLDANATQDTVIPKGARAQSIPGPGELPQSFEISEPLTARAAWNYLQPRLQQPYRVTRATVLGIDRLHLQGTALNLKTDDHLLLVFGDEAEDRFIRRIHSSEPLLGDNRTLVRLQPVFIDQSADTAYLYLAHWRARLTETLAANESIVAQINRVFSALLSNIALGSWRSVSDFAGGMRRLVNPLENPVMNDLIEQLLARMPPLVPGDPTTTPTDVQSLTASLLQPARAQPRNALRQRRSVAEVFKNDADAVPQLLVNFAPPLAESFYDAWSKATLNDAQTDLRAIYTLRLTAAPFGSNAPARTGLAPNVDDTSSESDLRVRQIVTLLTRDWPLANEADNELWLDAQYDGVLPGSFVLIEQPMGSNLPSQRFLASIDSVSHQTRSDYQLSGKTSRLQLDRKWRNNVGSETLAALRNTLIRTHSEPLQLAQMPIEQELGMPLREGAETDDEYQVRLDDSRRIELDQLHPGLQAGRWLIITGERSDIAATTGVIHSELAMLANVEQNYNPALAGDQTHTTLVLETPLAHRYKRASVKIHGNVVKATHGETRSETLGSGNAAVSLQSFTLKQPPLTYIAVNTSVGAASTLEVYVNDLRWHESDSLAAQAPNARMFITKTDDEARTTVIFGNGKEGARLPTGTENIKARYRNGIGKAGNVAAGQISLLASRPLGVKEVINPLRATGGSDRETRDQARANAPLALKALDRLVSVKDYEDFARLFAGIGKASARELSDGQRRHVHVTIAGADDIPLDPTSDLFQNLHQALVLAGDPHQPLVLAIRELMFVVISANIRLLPDYLWEPVVTAVRAALLQRFGFAQRQLGQPLFLSEVIGCIQGVAGVDYVDVDYLRGVPEKELGSDGERRLLTPERISDILTGDAPYNNCGGEQQSSTGKHSSDPLSHLCVNLADVEGGAIRPAQLAFLNPEVPATLILNPIS